VDLSGWVGAGLGGNCDCRCGILMLICWPGRGGFAGLVSSVGFYDYLFQGALIPQTLLYIAVRGVKGEW